MCCIMLMFRPLFVHLVFEFVPNTSAIMLYSHFSSLLSVCHVFIVTE